MFDLAKQDFCNQEALSFGRLPPRASFTPCESREAALQGLSKRADCLSGDWDFRFFDRALDVTLDVVLENADAQNGYAPIPVPCSWQFAGYGAFLYTDESYPFPINPPFVPAENPTGVYKRYVFWDGEGRAFLRLEGVESFCRVYCNGQDLGFTKGSRLPAEFELTPSLKKGDNALCLVVHQHSDGSYLEDQDAWRLGGIIRDLYFIKRPQSYLEDLVVDADYDRESGCGLLRLRPKVAGKAGLWAWLLDAEGKPLIETALKGEARFQIPAVRPWNAEEPALYTLLVQVETEKGEVEWVRQDIGFRRVEISQGQLLLNGVRVILRGVNRHEFSPDRGRAISFERTEKDLLLMKRHHINAVRCSHYPNNPFFYELCDRLGLYVMDECDLETHGFEIEGAPKRLANDPSWQAAYLDRAQRMLARDRNHPSVILWSLGNESYFGRNFVAMQEYLNREDTRPVHYEGDADFRHHLDLTSSMYSSLGLLQEIDLTQVNKPHILCEFAHAMGNGPGGLREYTDLMEASKRIQGYFVWEWRDHGVLSFDEKGQAYYRYGGEFGEKMTSGNFCMDGLLKADSQPTPGFEAYAKAIEPLRVIKQAESGWLVRNRFDFRDTRNCRAFWRLFRDGQEIAAQTEALPLIAPHREGLLPLPPGLLPAEMDNALFTLELEMRDEQSLLGRAQRILRDFIPLPLARAKAPEYLEDTAGYLIKGRDFSLSLSKSDGVLRALSYQGQILMEEGPKIDFFRAYLDNDKPFKADWEALKLRQIQQTLLQAEVTSLEDRLQFRLKAILGAQSKRWTAPTEILYEVFADGQIRCHFSLDFEGELGESYAHALPRQGTSARLSGRFEKALYQAYGPGESYCDSLDQARMGIFTQDIDDMAFPYECPQESGNRTGCHFVSLVDQEGFGLSFATLSPGDMSVKRHTDEDLFLTAHHKDLPRRDNLTLHFDKFQTGLGSASCGPAPFKAYVAKAIPFTWDFAITPFVGDALAGARRGLQGLVD